MATEEAADKSLESKSEAGAENKPGLDDARGEAVSELGDLTNAETSKAKLRYEQSAGGKIPTGADWSNASKLVYDMLHMSIVDKGVNILHNLLGDKGQIETGKGDSKTAADGKAREGEPERSDKRSPEAVTDSRSGPAEVLNALKEAADKQPPKPESLEVRSSDAIKEGDGLPPEKTDAPTKPGVHTNEHGDVDEVVYPNGKSAKISYDESDPPGPTKITFSDGTEWRPAEGKGDTRWCEYKDGRPTGQTAADFDVQRDGLIIKQDAGEAVERWLPDGGKTETDVECEVSEDRFGNVTAKTYPGRDGAGDTVYAYTNGRVTEVRTADGETYTQGQDVELALAENGDCIISKNGEVTCIKHLDGSTTEFAVADSGQGDGKMGAPASRAESRITPGDSATTGAEELIMPGAPADSHADKVGVHARDANGNPTDIVDAHGHHTHVSYDLDGMPYRISLDRENTYLEKTAKGWVELDPLLGTQTPVLEDIQVTKDGDIIRRAVDGSHSEVRHCDGSAIVTRGESTVETNSADQVTRVSYPGGKSCQIQYGSNGQPTEIRYSNGEQWKAESGKWNHYMNGTLVPEHWRCNFEVKTNGDIVQKTIHGEETSIRHANGSETEVREDHARITRNAAGQITDLTTPNGKSRHYTYENNELTAIDAGDWLRKKEGGQWQLYQLDQERNFVKDTEAADVTQIIPQRDGSLEYHYPDGTTACLHPDGTDIWQYGDGSSVTRDSEKRPTMIAEPGGQVRKIHYDKDGQPDRLENIPGETLVRKTTPGFPDVFVDSVNPDHAFSKVTVDSVTGAISVVESDTGVEQVYIRDGRRETNFPDHSQWTTDQAGRLSSMTYPGGRGTDQFGYDPVGNLTRIERSDGTAWEPKDGQWIEYNDRGKPTGQTAAELKTWVDPAQFGATDSQGRTIWLMNPDGSKTNFQYDKDGNALAVKEDPVGKVGAPASHAESRITPGDSATTEAEELIMPGAPADSHADKVGVDARDANGNPTQIVDAKHRTAFVSNDADGNPMRIVLPEESYYLEKTSEGWFAVDPVLGTKEAVREDITVTSDGDIIRNATDGTYSEVRYADGSKLTTRGQSFVEIDSNGKVAKVKYPSGQSCEIDYDVDGNPSMLKYSNGEQWKNEKGTWNHYKDGNLLVEKWDSDFHVLPNGDIAQMIMTEQGVEATIRHADGTADTERGGVYSTRGHIPKPDVTPPGTSVYRLSHPATTARTGTYGHQDDSHSTSTWRRSGQQSERSVTPGEGAAGDDFAKRVEALKSVMESPDIDEGTVIKALEAMTPEQRQALIKLMGNLEPDLAEGLRGYSEKGAMSSTEKAGDATDQLDEDAEARSMEIHYNPEVAKEAEALVARIGDRSDDPVSDVNRVQADMSAFERRAATQNPPLTPEQIRDTYKEISKMLDAPAKDFDRMERLELAKQILHQAAEPTSISQGSNNTCTVATLETRTYTNHPEAAAKLVCEVATTGQFKTADGSVIKCPENNRHADDEAWAASEGVEGKRSHASQLFEITAVNIAHTRDNAGRTSPKIVYEDVTPVADRNPPDTGERIMDYSQHPAKEVLTNTPDLGAERIPDINYQITGQHEKGIVIQHDHFRKLGSDTVPLTKPEDLKNMLEADPPPTYPIIIQVHTGNEPFHTDAGGRHGGGDGGWHMVTITGYDKENGNVYVDNQWKPDADHGKDDPISVRQLYEATKHPSDMTDLPPLRTPGAGVGDTASDAHAIRPGEGLEVAQFPDDMSKKMFEGTSLDFGAPIGHGPELTDGTDLGARQRLRHDSEVMAERQKLEKAAERIPEPQKTEFLKNSAAFEKRVALLEKEYQKQFESAGISPEEAARKAQKKSHEEVRDTYANIERLLQANDSAPVEASDRMVLAEQCMEHCADITSIAQGNHATCFAASVETRTFARDPAEATRLVADVATKGKYTTSGAGQITVDLTKDEYSIKKQGESNEVPPKKRQDGHRDYASQIFQTTAANIALEQQNALTHPRGHLRYEQHPDHSGDKPPHDSGERVKDYSETPPRVVDYEMGLNSPLTAGLVREISPNNSDGPITITSSRDWQRFKTVLDAAEAATAYDFEDCGLEAEFKHIDIEDPDRCKKLHEAIDKKDGLTDEQRKGLHKDVNALATASCELGQRGSLFQGANEERVKEFLTYAKSGGELPIIFAVDAVNEPFWTDSKAGAGGGAGGGHSIVITDFDPDTGTCKIKNHWGKDSSHDINVTDLCKATEDNEQHRLDTMQERVDANRRANKVDFVLELKTLDLKHSLGKVPDQAEQTAADKKYEEQRRAILQEWSDRNHRKGEANPDVDYALVEAKRTTGQLTDQQYLDELDALSKAFRKEGDANFQVEYDLLHMKYELGKVSGSAYDEQIVALTRERLKARDKYEDDAPQDIDERFRMESRTLKAMLKEIDEQDKTRAEKIKDALKKLQT